MSRSKSDLNWCSRCDLCCSGLAGAQFLTDEDITAIESSGITDFYVKKPGADFHTLKAKNGVCIFYDLPGRKCKIYDMRPVDCRLFPYDILYKNGAYYWMKWKLSDCVLFGMLDDEAAIRQFEKGLSPKFAKYLKQYSDYTDAMISRAGANSYTLIRAVDLNK